MVFKVLHESLKTYINNLISSTIGVLLLQTREQSWRHGNLVLCRPRAKLCPLARRTYFSGWRAVSHADLVWKSRADLESALGVPFGGNLVENRPEPGNSSKFSLAPLGPDMSRASGHAQPGTGDGGWPEAGWETAAGRAVTRRLGVARNRSRERHHRQHRGQHHQLHHRQHPEPAARLSAEIFLHSVLLVICLEFPGFAIILHSVLLVICLEFPRFAILLH